MTDTFDFEVKHSWLTALGEVLGNTATLSPFRFGTPEGDPRAEMVQSGLMSADGQIQPGFLEPLQLLAAPSRVSRLRFMSPDTTVEYQAFFAGAERTPVALMSTETGYLVRSPADPQAALRLIVEMSGGSPRAGIMLQLDLPIHEARVALALVDATRQHCTMVLAAEAELTVPVMTAEDLAERLTPDSEHLNRLETCYRSLEVDDTPMDAASVGVALAGLAGKGLATAAEGGYAPAGSLRDLGESLLLVDGIYQFDTVTDDGGAIGSGRGVVVAGGSRSLLLMEHDNGTIRFAGLSGEAFVHMVSPLFMVEPPEGTLPEAAVPAQPAPAVAAPPAHTAPAPAAPAQPAPPVAPAAPPPPAPPQAVPAAQPQAGAKFCGKCGNPVNAGTKFCGKCGNPMG